MASSRSNGTEIELDPYHTQGVPNDPSISRSDTITGNRDGTEVNNVSPLEPADGGTAAWKLLCAAFVFEALLWGFPLSFGVFQDYYSQLPEFAGDPYTSVVGTVASGISYIGAPLVTPIIRRLVAGSFAKTLPSLILTQGVMYGIGFIIFYYPILSLVDEFWVSRRGMAYGILCGASGASGTVMPLILQALLRRYGYPTTLRAIAVTLFLATGPLIPLLKGRLPTAETEHSFERTDWSFVKKPLFWVYSLSNVIQGLGYFFPSLYLPSYATSIGLSALQGALLLTLMSVSQVLGQFTFGYLSDRKVPLNILITVSMLVSSIVTFALWGISRSFAPLLVFAVLFGFFGAGYTALWARMVSAVSEGQSAALAMFSLFCFGKGVGNVLAGPISTGLILPAVSVSSYGALKYKPVVIFTGGSMLLSAICVSTWYMKPKRQGIQRST